MGKSSGYDVAASFLNANVFVYVDDGSPANDPHFGKIEPDGGFVLGTNIKSARRKFFGDEVDRVDRLTVGRSAKPRRFPVKPVCRAEQPDIAPRPVFAGIAKRETAVRKDLEDRFVKFRIKTPLRIRSKRAFANTNIFDILGDVPLLTVDGGLRRFRFRF